MKRYTVTHLDAARNRCESVDIEERADTLATERARSWLRGFHWDGIDGGPVEVTALIERFERGPSGDYLAEKWTTTVEVDPYTLELGSDSVPGEGCAA